MCERSDQIFLPGMSALVVGLAAGRSLNSGLQGSRVNTELPTALCDSRLTTPKREAVRRQAGLQGIPGSCDGDVEGLGSLKPISKFLKSYKSVVKQSLFKIILQTQ